MPHMGCFGVCVFCTSAFSNIVLNAVLYMTRARYEPSILCRNSSSTYLTALAVVLGDKDWKLPGAPLLFQDVKTGKYLVRFDDGTERAVKDDELIVCELLRAGQAVYADDDDESGYVLAVVVSHWRHGLVTGYTVKFVEGDKVKKYVVCLVQRQLLTVL